MMKSFVKTLGLFLAITFISQSAARADFEGPFAPSNWTFSGDANSNSLTSTQMQITSLDVGFGHPMWGQRARASYSINVPGNTVFISFDYQYSTTDIDDSGFDMARYSVNGVTTDFVPINITNQSGSITLNNISGSSFAIIQEALDSALGSATITISNFRYRTSFSDFLMNMLAPQITLAEGKATCTPGTYRFASGSNAVVSSTVYTLVVNGQPISRLAYDPTGSIAPHLFSSIKHTASGVATSEKAIWDVSALSNFEAHCEVAVAKSGSMFNSSSNSIEDAVKIAKKNAAAQAWEDQRAAATAANYTKEKRELRKRLAARAGN
jgi:hypothetical protein